MTDWLRGRFSMRLALASALVLVLAAAVTDLRLFPLALTAAVLAFALWLSGSSEGKAREMAAVADRLARGEYDARMRTPSPDELGRLARTLNLLAERVEATVLELSRDKAQLASVLEGMVEGVLAVDADGRVLIANPALARLFGLEASTAVGRPFLEVLRHVEVGRLISAVLDGGGARAEEIVVLAPEERVFEAHAAPLPHEGGALLVLHDVTRTRRLEAVRRDFVANVSHELRTPLTSIKGFAETLKSGGIDDAEHRLEFVETIERHADQLTRLVDDLLDLSAIESGRSEPRFEPLALAQAAAEAAEGLRPLAARRRVAIEMRLPADLPRVRADRGQLKQVLVNLFDNAVKFNKEGGSVALTARPEGPMVEVSVQDTGAGIPEPDLPRVFERFYRVDKARSRELGGTGLGLAIVKHIVEAHGGRVSVASEPGSGSTFRFTLPAA